MSVEKLFEFVDDHVGLQLASVALLSLALVPIYTGSFTSLRAMKHEASTARLKRTSHSISSPFEDSDDEGEEKSQVLSIKDIFLFPIIGSVLVYSAYLALNEVEPKYVNQAIQVLTSILSCAVFSNTAVLIAKRLLPSECLNRITKYKFSFSKKDQRLCHLNVTVIHLLVFAISVGLAFSYAVSKNWVIGNLFAICLAINAIGLLSVDSFFTGFLLLLGMLAFDVFWLFGTDIMENISKALTSAPTSIVWPRNINTHLFNKLLKTDQYFTMFGLGDIIVPGIYIAYCLRFDKLNSWKTASSRRNSDFTSTRFSKPYFIASLLAYAVSAGASIYTVHFTKKAQSALLFIVPALILSTITTALIRNELSTVLSCSDVVKTFSKLCSFSANDEEDDERPSRFKKVTRSNSVTGNGRSVSKGGSKSKAVRSLSKEISDESDESNFEAKKGRSIEEDVIAEHSTPKTTRKKRSSSKANKK